MIQWFIQSFMFYSFILFSFVHSFVHSFAHSFIQSFIQSFILSFFHSFIHSFIHSFLFFRKSCHRGPITTFLEIQQNVRWDVCVWIVLHVLQYLTPWYDRPMLLKCCLFFRKGRCGELERGMDRYGSSFRLIYCYQSFLFIFFLFFFPFPPCGGAEKNWFPARPHKTSFQSGLAPRYRPHGRHYGTGRTGSSRT